MEQTNFSIRKCFEELRKEQKLSLGDIVLTIGIQDEICKQVEAQEKKYRDNINLLLVTVQGLQDQIKVEEANVHDTVLIIDTLQRAVATLNGTGDTVGRDRVVKKMLEYIEQL